MTGFPGSVTDSRTATADLRHAPSMTSHAFRLLISIALGLAFAGTAGAQPDAAATAPSAEVEAEATPAASQPEAPDAVPDPALPPTAEGEIQANWLMTDARALHAEGRYADAVALAARAAELSPDRTAPRILHGWLLLEMRSFGQAATVLEMARAIDDGDAELWILSGDAYLGSGRTRRARAAYERALELQPDHAVAQERLTRMRMPARILTSGRLARTKRGPSFTGHGTGHWEMEVYGGAMAGLWVASIFGGLMLAGSLDSYVPALMLGVPPAILHFAHDNIGLGVLDLFAFYATAFVGGALGAATCSDGGDGGDNFECLANVMLGALAGGASWVIIDSAFLARKRVWREGPVIEVSLLPTRGGATLGLTTHF